MQDDDDHSSGDFQNQGYEDNEEDVIRALGMENVRRLASLTNGELADFEDSSSEDSRPADSGHSESTSDISSDNLPSRRFCTNCTDELDPGRTTCLVLLRPLLSVFKDDQLFSLRFLLIICPKSHDYAATMDRPSELLLLFSL